MCPVLKRSHLFLLLVSVYFCKNRLDQAETQRREKKHHCQSSDPYLNTALSVCQRFCQDSSPGYLSGSEHVSCSRSAAHVQCEEVKGLQVDFGGNKKRKEIRVTSLQQDTFQVLRCDGSLTRSHVLCADVDGEAVEVRVWSEQNWEELILIPSRYPVHRDLITVQVKFWTRCALTFSFGELKPELSEDGTWLRLQHRVLGLTVRSRVQTQTNKVSERLWVLSDFLISSTIRRKLWAFVGDYFQRRINLHVVLSR